MVGDDTGDLYLRLRAELPALREKRLCGGKETELVVGC